MAATISRTPLRLSRTLLRTRPSGPQPLTPLVATKAFSTSIARLEPPRDELQTRNISSSAAQAEESNPSHASISDIKQEFPDLHDRPKGDYGHSTTGGGVGKHTKRTLGSLSMDGKVCVVTGAARGLGNLFARTFVESGSNAIAILDLSESEATKAASDLVQWFEENGETSKGEISAIGLGCDVSNEDDVKAAFEQIVEKFGRIDTLVTAAGIVENFKANDYPTAKFRKLFSVNVDGSFFCAREAAADMMRRKEPGSIILVGSMSGSVVNVPQPQTPYNASKAAVRQMAASLAVEWAKDGIRVNCLAPGYMATSLTRTILDKNPDLKHTWENLTPMGRVGEPEDLKGAIVYLASDAAAFTTGVELKVDGGYTLT